MNIKKIEYVSIQLTIFCKLNGILQKNSMGYKSIWTSIEKRSYLSNLRKRIFKWLVSLILTLR